MNRDQQAHHESRRKYKPDELETQRQDGAERHDGGRRE